MIPLSNQWCGLHSTTSPSTRFPDKLVAAPFFDSRRCGHKPGAGGLVVAGCWANGMARGWLLRATLFPLVPRPSGAGFVPRVSHSPLPLGCGLFGVAAALVASGLTTEVWV